ncbi:MAG: L,D-transpeptidase [Actinobacteria bacterium]|nr:L,D-transpeptidase [Actinomycetota bacterium]
MGGRFFVVGDQLGGALRGRCSNPPISKSLRRASEGRHEAIVRLRIAPAGPLPFVGLDRQRTLASRRRIVTPLLARTRLDRSARARPPSTPTPRGLAAIYERDRQPDPRDFVGTWVLALTARSDVLKHFEGGTGRIGIHGRAGASLLDPLGSARSHGCVAMQRKAPLVRGFRVS